MSGQGGGRSAADIHAAHTAWADQQEAVTRCALCDWSYFGTVAEGRALAVGHRRVHHPDRQPTRRRRGSLQRWNKSDDGFRDEGLAGAAEVAAMLARREGA